MSTGRASWQVGQVGLIELHLTHPKTKLPLSTAANRVWVRLTRPDGSTVEPRMFTGADGEWNAEQEWDQAGDWTGHVLCTGECKTKEPFPYLIRVGND